MFFRAFEERTGMKTGGANHSDENGASSDGSFGPGHDNDARQRRRLGSGCRASECVFLPESHDKKEQGMLYPMMDRAFGKEEGSALLARTSLGRRDP